jgi:hypothetical protein
LGTDGEKILDHRLFNGKKEKEKTEKKKKKKKKKEM